MQIILEPGAQPLSQPNNCSIGHLIKTLELAKDFIVEPPDQVQTRKGKYFRKTTSENGLQFLIARSNVENSYPADNLLEADLSDLKDIEP